ECAQTLAAEGMSVEVLDPRSLLPLDRDAIIASAKKTGRVIIFDDSNRVCGFAAEVSAVVAESAFEALKAPIRRVTRADVPVPFSAALEPAVLPSRERLLAECRRMLAKA
ncbi:MAG: alpha-ketoacid dehydrogenase subunit beta, partial [Elusimicrobia bacterium]|nr:alpha-ketoacid dehydrogenase subunit beta [Elusimicrobiota bacterium]